MTVKGTRASERPRPKVLCRPPIEALRIRSVMKTGMISSDIVLSRTQRDYTRGKEARSNDFSIVETFKFGKTIMKEKLFLSDRTVSMLADQNVRNALSLRIRRINLLPIDKHHNIRILFDCPTLAEISKHRDRWLARLDSAAQL